MILDLPGIYFAGLPIRRASHVDLEISLSSAHLPIASDKESQESDAEMAALCLRELHSKETRFRRAAAQKLGRLCWKPATEILARLAQDDPDAAVRNLATEAVARIASRRLEPLDLSGVEFVLTTGDQERNANTDLNGKAVFSELAPNAQVSLTARLVATGDLDVLIRPNFRVVRDNEDWTIFARSVASSETLALAAESHDEELAAKGHSNQPADVKTFQFEAVTIPGGELYIKLEMDSQGGTITVAGNGAPGDLRVTVGGATEELRVDSSFSELHGKKRVRMTLEDGRQCLFEYRIYSHGQE